MTVDRRRPRVHAALLALLVAFSLLSGSSLAAPPSEPPTPGASSAATDSALRSIAAREDSPIARSLPSSTALDRPMPIGAGTVTVPSQLEDGVRFDGADGVSIRVTPTSSPRSASAEPLADGGVHYPGPSHASSVIVSATGVQMLTTIVDADAPARYAYDLDLAPGQIPEPLGEGIAVKDSDGDIVLTVGAPWALDANGQAVSTRFEITGSTLTQVVDHSDDSIAYPVVADPIMLAPWMVKCLVGIGIRGPDLVRSASMGTPQAILAAFGRGAVACLFGK